MTIMGTDQTALHGLWRVKRGEARAGGPLGNLPVQLGKSRRPESALVRGQQRSGQVVDVQRHVRHPVLHWMGATLDGRVEATGAIFEAKFMLPWSFSEEAAVEKYAPQLQHNLWVVAARRAAVLSVITGGGKWVKSRSRRIHFTSISSSLLSGSSGGVSRAASPLASSAPTRRSRA